MHEFCGPRVLVGVAEQTASSACLGLCLKSNDFPSTPSQTSRGKETLKGVIGRLLLSSDLDAAAHVDRRARFC